MQKELSSLQGDDSEESKKRIQELKVSLEEAEADLEETEFDRYISQQEQLLDNLYTEYELLLNERLDNTDNLIQQVIDGVNAAASLSAEQSTSLLAALGDEGTLATALGVEGAIATAIVNAVGENGSIKSILNKEVTAVGATLSTKMGEIWTTEGTGTNSVLATYGKGFQDKQTTTNNVLSGIKSGVDSMVASLNKEAGKKVDAPKTKPAAKANPVSNGIKEVNATDKDKSSSGGDGKPKVGDKVKFLSGQYYYSSDGSRPLGSMYQGKQVYITSINTASWATHPYHISLGNKLGKNDLGWLKLNQISGYASGKKKLSNDEYAWTQEKGREYIVRPSDGAILTPVAKGDSVLTSAATNNIWSMANNPAEFIKDNLNLGSTSVPNNSTVQNSITQNLENVTFSFPNVHSYEEMLAAMQKDKNFERLITSMSIDRLAGKSSLAKGKAIR